MRDSILIVGGYGAVGSEIASELLHDYGDQLIIAGRTSVKAANLAAQLGSRVRWRYVDVTKQIDYDAVFEDVRLVVMCLDLPDVEFVRQGLRRGIGCIDISAEYPQVAAIAGLRDLARQHGASAILSVGLVPGLSNLLARHSLRFVNPVVQFDTALLAGMGEKHGVAGSSWILDHFTGSAGSLSINFPEPYRRRTVHRFAFSDQCTLTETLPITNAATWLGFDSRLMTRLIGLGRSRLLRPLFQTENVRRLLLSSTQRFHFGTEEFVLLTRAKGANGIYQAVLRGCREAAVTALVAAEVVRMISAEPIEAGVHHIEQLYELEAFLPRLEHYGVAFTGSML